MQTHPEPFGPALRDLLIAKNLTTPIGNLDWVGFAELLRGVSYETLRKAITNERPVSEKIVEAVSQALTVEPATFVEYRLLRAQREFDWREVGFNQAVMNLRRWEGAASG